MKESVFKPWLLQSTLYVTKILKSCFYYFETTRKLKFRIFSRHWFCLYIWLWCRPEKTIKNIFHKNLPASSQCLHIPLFCITKIFMVKSTLSSFDWSNSTMKVIEKTGLKFCSIGMTEETKLYRKTFKHQKKEEKKISQKQENFRRFDYLTKSGFFSRRLSVNWRWLSMIWKSSCGAGMRPVESFDQIGISLSEISKAPDEISCASSMFVKKNVIIMAKSLLSVAHVQNTGVAIPRKPNRSKELPMSAIRRYLATTRIFEMYMLKPKKKFAHQPEL